MNIYREHLWWAWRPVRTPEGWRWLTFVLRRRIDNAIKGSQNHWSGWAYWSIT